MDLALLVHYIDHTITSLRTTSTRLRPMFTSVNWWLRNPVLSGELALILSIGFPRVTLGLILLMVNQKPELNDFLSAVASDPITTEAHRSHTLTSFEFCASETPITLSLERSHPEGVATG
jgi:hypothetical protein